MGGRGRCTRREEEERTTDHTDFTDVGRFNGIPILSSREYLHTYLEEKQNSQNHDRR